MSELTDVIRTRRSIRHYAHESVTPEQIDALKEAVLRAPSSRGLRAGRYVFVTDRAALGDLARCKPRYADFLAGAGLGVVVAADESVSDVWVEDASIAATFLQLAAADLGLGSCWVQIRGREYRDGVSSEDRVREICELPPGYRVDCIISIGVPAEDKPPWADGQLKPDAISEV